MTVYATAAELAAYMDPDSANPATPPLATVLLRAASALVDDETSGAIYTADENGMPTALPVLTAFKAATMEQASAWSIHGIDPRKGAGGVARRVSSKALGGAQVSYVADAAADTYLSDLASGAHLTDAAWRILHNAGLISTRVITGANGHERFNVSQRTYDPITGTYT